VGRDTQKKKHLETQNERIAQVGDYFRKITQATLRDKMIGDEVQAEQYD
jgi:hypothetical protein